MTHYLVTRAVFSGTCPLLLDKYILKKLVESTRRQPPQLIIATRAPLDGKVRK
jgi:hypothetical protein